ncbi:MAG: ABC transporter permease [Chloroflexota bacterium]
MPYSTLAFDTIEHASVWLAAMYRGWERMKGSWSGMREAAQALPTSHRWRTSHDAATRLPAARGFYGLAWSRYRQNPVAVAALAVVVVIALFAIGADAVSAVTGFDYRENHLDTRLARPGEHGYLLGSDGNGRDILTRLAYGGRVSLTVAVLATFSTMVLGGSIGVAAGFFGRWADGVAMRVADILLSIPTLSLLILLSTLYRPGYLLLGIFIASVGWPGLARLVRGEVLTLRKRDYIDAARVIGATNRRIIVRHLVPNVAPVMIIWGSQVIPGFIITEAALSFLGLGVRIPTPSWGNMLYEAQSVYRSHPTNVIFPGLLIFLTALSINLVGNGLRDALDPRLKDAARP